jgi:hypothetical protein
LINDESSLNSLYFAEYAKRIIRYKKEYLTKVWLNVSLADTGTIMYAFGIPKAATHSLSRTQQGWISRPFRRSLFVARTPAN